MATDIPRGAQGLIKRHPALTPAQFSEYWLHTHGRLGLGFALASGCTYYAQIHRPRLAQPAAAPSDLDIGEWDGAAELEFAPNGGGGVSGGLEEKEEQQQQQQRKRDDFFRRVILPDERRFMVDEARKHARFVPPGTVTGDKIVLIRDSRIVLGEDGRPVLDPVEGIKMLDEWVVAEDGSEGVAGAAAGGA